MEKRPFFIAGDLISNAAVGALAALATHALIAPYLGMFVGMVLGMVLGMIISMLLTTLLFSVIWGAMEVMLPCMVSGMVAGMVPAMWHSSSAVAMERGVWIGIVVVLVTYLLSTAFSLNKEGQQA